MSARIAISIGDYNGIGTEVIIKTLQQIDLQSITTIILGSEQILDFYLKSLDAPLDYRVIPGTNKLSEGGINLINLPFEEDIDIAPGTVSASAGRYAMLAVEVGLDLCMQNETDALVTAPISKEAVNRAGYHIPGHTEFLAEKTGTDRYLMMLVNEGLRVGLYTTHIPLGEVVSRLSVDSLASHLHVMNGSLSGDFGISNPAIAVLGVNPHAGDGGMIGEEERQIIGPAIEKARSEGIDAGGPYPADGFFGNRNYKQFDGILAIYHDQGLIPFKTLSFGKGVNFTAGLPIIRTSPDHGTAFDIAGKGEANPASFIQAFTLAVTLAGKRTTQLS